MKKSRKISAIAIVILLMSMYILPTKAATPIKLKIDGTNVNFTKDSGTPYINEKNRILVPVRVVGEAVGAEVFWDSEYQIVILQKDDITVTVPINANYIYRGSDKIKNTSSSVIKKGRAYLSIRVILETFGYKVTWDQATTTIVSTSPGYIEPKESPYPSKFDVRTINRLTSIRDQGDIGACWAFATMGALETGLMPIRDFDFSEDHISLNHGYNLTQDQGGDYKMSLAYLTSWKGPILEKEDPYGDGMTVHDKKAAIHVQEAKFLKDKDYEAIKEAVMQYGAVQTSVYSPVLNGDLNSLYYNPETSSMYNFDDKVPDHDIIIVGWDDNYDASNFLIKPPGNGAFIAKNSWGTEFGDKGYYYVSYYDTNIGTHNVVYSRIDNADNYDKIYQHDELGYVTGLGYMREKAMAANVYTPNDNELLKAVGFYALSEGTSYKVYVVTDYKDMTSFESMQLVAEGQFKRAGYYTVDFNEAVALTKDTPYAVVLEVSSPGLKFPIAAEMINDNAYAVNVPMEPGQSFLSHDGQVWEDSVIKLNVNVALKAYTDIVHEEAVDGEQPPDTEEPVDPNAENPDQTDGEQEDGTKEEDQNQEQDQNGEEQPEQPDQPQGDQPEDDQGGNGNAEDGKQDESNPSNDDNPESEQPQQPGGENTNKVTDSSGNLFNKKLNVIESLG